jgi:hypothetical protein
MVRIMSSLGQRLHREYDGGLLTLIAALPRDGYPLSAQALGSQPLGSQTQRLPSSIRRIQSA